MSKKLDALKKMVFFAKEDPTPLAEVLEGLVTDVVTSVKLTGADSIEIPTGGTSNTAEYVGKAFSQYGDEMANSVTLALKEAVTGVSISSGTVTVDKTATAESFVVKATCGTVVAEKTITLVSHN